MPAGAGGELARDLAAAGLAAGHAHAQVVQQQALDGLAGRRRQGVVIEFEEMGSELFSDGFCHGGFVDSLKGRVGTWKGSGAGRADDGNQSSEERRGGKAWVSTCRSRW